MALGIGVIDENILFCRVVSEGDVDKNISTIGYNNRDLYESIITL